MVYGANEILAEELIKWCRSLEIPEFAKEKDEISNRVNNVIKSTVRIIKNFPECEIRREGWYAVRRIVNQAFMDKYVKYNNRGIRIANYFEVFIGCVDLKTEKRLIKGIGFEARDTGRVSLYENGVKIGEIGEQSDLIWSTYIDYFIVDEQDGFAQHTLSVPEKILSLQLWNVQNKTEKEIEEYIERVLVDVSITHGLKFKILSVQELWTESGSAGEFEVNLSTQKYESMPLLYLSHGLNCDDDRIAYLHLYQVIEYFFVRAQNSFLKRNIKEECDGGIDGLTDIALCNILRKYTHSLNEATALKLVIKQSITADWVKNFISESSERISQYTVDRYAESKIVINLNGNSEKILERIADRIYFFRCAIAHAKGDTGGFVVMPSLNRSEISEELPLLREVAKKVIEAWS